MPRISALNPNTPTTTDSVPIYDPETGSTKRVTISDLITLFAANMPADDGYSLLSNSVSSVTYNGNRSATINFSSTVSAILYPFMRMRFDRATNASTQCTSLNGSTQYWVKTSPNKLTFTDDFVVSAWVKLSSYSASKMVIASRYNGTSGWELNLVASTGQAQLTGYNGSSGNYSYVVSYQSIPLNKWVHITAQLDMSSYTATSTTSYVMIDGSDAPCTVFRSGTNPTALVQAGNLEIGTSNATSFFPGKIAQVAIFNAKVTQSTIRGYISQGLTGSETSLASAYSFNNSTSDLNTTTPNDLSAGAGSPTATNSDSPFSKDSSNVPGSYDFAIVQTVSGSTVNVLIPEGCAIPTTGSFTSVEYSSVYAPQGFPLQQERWQILYMNRTGGTQTNPVSGTWYNLTGTSGVSGGHKINAPIGIFKEVSYRVVGSASTTTTSNAVSAYATLSTGSSTETDTEMTTRFYVIPAGATSNQMLSELIAFKPMSFSVATDLYLNMKVDLANETALQSYGNNSPTLIKLVPAGI